MDNHICLLIIFCCRIFSVWGDTCNFFMTRINSLTGLNLLI